MHEHAQRVQWNHTSNLICCIANANRDPAKKPTPFSYQDFHPYFAAKRKRDHAAGMPDCVMRAIAQAFVGKKLEKPPGLFEQITGEKPETT